MVNRHWCCSHIPWHRGKVTMMVEVMVMAVVAMVMAVLVVMMAVVMVTVVAVVMVAVAEAALMMAMAVVAVMADICEGLLYSKCDSKCCPTKQIPFPSPF